MTETAKELKEKYELVKQKIAEKNKELLGLQAKIDNENSKYKKESIELQKRIDMLKAEIEVIEKKRQDVNLNEIEILRQEFTRTQQFISSGMQRYETAMNIESEIIQLKILFGLSVIGIICLGILIFLK